MDSGHINESDWRHSKLITVLLIIITVFLGVYALRMTWVVTMPLAFAFFVAVLVRPIQRWLDHRTGNKRHWLSLTLTMMTVVLVIALAVGAIWLSVEIVGDQAAEYAQKFQDMWRDVVAWGQSRGISIQENPMASRGIRQRVMEFMALGLTSVWELLAMLVLIFFLVLLMLIEAGSWRDKAREALKAKQAEGVVSMVDVVAGKVRRYLAVRTLMSLVSAVAGGLWLWLVGLDFALVWAMLIFMLNYVPNIGSILAVFPPALIALVQFGWLWALFVILGLTVIEQVVGNFIDPRLQGRTLEVSPIVVLVSIVFWSWVWGIAGALLAVPMMVVLIIICGHVEALKPLGLLLSRTASPEKLESETHNAD